MHGVQTMAYLGYKTKQVLQKANKQMCQLQILLTVLSKAGKLCAAGGTTAFFFFFCSFHPHNLLKLHQLLLIYIQQTRRVV